MRQRLLEPLLTGLTCAWECRVFLGCPPGTVSVSLVYHWR
jgi:hypothetical protein